MNRSVAICLIPGIGKKGGEFLPVASFDNKQSVIEPVLVVEPLIMKDVYGCLLWSYLFSKKVLWHTVSILVTLIRP